MPIGVSGQDMPISSHRRRDAASRAFSPGRGCPQHEVTAIRGVGDIHAVGHRIVHGGELFKESALIDDKVLQGIEECIDLAPLQQQAASAVPDHDREGTMQVAALMRFQLFLSSNFIVSSIDEDDVFAGHRMISSLHMPPRRPHHSIAVSEVAPRPV